MSATLKNTTENNNDCGLKVKNFWPSQDTSVFQQQQHNTGLLNNNEVFPNIEYTSKMSKGGLAHELDKEAKTQFWTRQSFINMYIQSKYLEILAKNQQQQQQPLLAGIKQEPDHECEPKSMSPPQEIPLDLSLGSKSIHSDGSSDQDVWSENAYKENLLLRKADPNDGLNHLIIPRNNNVISETSLTEQNELILNHNFIANLAALPIVTSYTCTVCGQSFNLQDRLAKHIASCHKQKKKPSDTGKTYECEICKRSFARSDMLTRHSRLHTGKTFQRFVMNEGSKEN